MAGIDGAALPSTDAARERPERERSKYTSLGLDADHSHQHVLALAKGARTVLEVGAATGYLSEALAADGAAVVAVEVDPVAARVGQERGIDIRVGTIESVVSPDERFDCIVLADVIEHIVDVDRFLGRVLRHLGDRGAIVLSVPNVAHLTVRLGLLVGHFDYQEVGLLDSTHVHFYTEASLEQLLSRHGLSVIEKRNTVNPYTLNRVGSDRVRRYVRRSLRELANRFPGVFAYQFVWKVVRHKG
jgi:2-polyprenyl-3-methyl-5-hydroxy-6-metoxy-1,4-benzoquinol methylase